MINSKFKLYLKEIESFNTLQFRKLREEVDKRVKKKKIANILETPENNLHCPHCNSSNHIKWGKRNDLQRYKCKNCKKTFNSLTKTPLARLRRKGHWLQYATCLKNELTIREAAKICKIHKNTSFRWRHRFITNFNKIKAKKLGGIIETGELIFKESFKGTKKFKPELIKPRKDIFIIYSIDRNNNIFEITNKGLSFKTLKKELDSMILADSLIYSNKRKPFINFFKDQKLNHVIVKNNNHKLSQINKLSEYRTEFKQWIYEHFKGVATKYLENYVSWYRGLKEFKSGINSLTILYRAKMVEKYRHQPLKVTRFI